MEQRLLILAKAKALCVEYPFYVMVTVEMYLIDIV